MASVAQRIADFDTWRPGYGAATVEVVRPGTTQLMPLYLDVGLTQPTGNPVLLLEMEENGIHYGKFEQPIYCAGAYQLIINQTDQTGIIAPPISNLIDEDVTYSVAQTARGTRLRRLIDRFNDVIRAEDFGEIGASPATNNATLNAAIGAAAGQGGGFVLLPPKSFEFTFLTIPGSVILVGEGQGVTVMRSQEAQAVITMGGPRAGLANLTLDGENLVPGSIGIVSDQNDRILFNSVTLKRFELGARFKGGLYHRYYDFAVENCVDGIQLLGEDRQFAHLVWDGGKIISHTDRALDLRYVNQIVRQNTFSRLQIEDNISTALYLEGPHFTLLNDCQWGNNLVNVDVTDGSDTSKGTDNKAINIMVTRGQMVGGSNSFDKTSQDVRFVGTEFQGTSWDLSLPDNVIVLEDPIESTAVVVTGDGTKLARYRVNNDGMIINGVTTDANFVTAFSYTLAPGQVVMGEAKIIGNSRNNNDYALYHIEAGCRRPGASLAYDNQTANFTVGTIVTGGTSGAVGRIVADADGGTTGTLTLRSIVGSFIDNEIITDTSGGSAQVNGVLSFSNAALDSGGNTAIRAAVEIDATWDARWAVSGGNLILEVRGNTGDTVDWTVFVRLFAP